ncbi:MAG: hypothetical protein K2X48_09675 [Chitinophagaceae bacterium]|nr:hypothetical protein [Chitinophagaceae bacterium]
MKAFLFLTRAGFILNLVFLLCLVLHYIPSAEWLPQSAVSVLLIGGWVLSILINLVMAVYLAVLLLMGKRNFQMPVIVVLNMLVFLFQIFYFFFYDTSNH